MSTAGVTITRNATKEIITEDGNRSPSSIVKNKVPSYSFHLTRESWNMFEKRFQIVGNMALLLNFGLELMMLESKENSSSMVQGEPSKLLISLLKMVFATMKISTLL